MPVMQNHAGRTFGRITLSEPVSGKTGYWKGKCSCGNPVEKRVDNLKRPGHHSCGKCLAPTPGTDLEERVRRLEGILASMNPGLRPGLAAVVNECPQPAVPSEVNAPPQEQGASRFSNVTHDAEGELWEARTLTGRAFFWGITEQEAAYAARLYLERTHATFNRRLITDAELNLTDERRAEIRTEVAGVYRVAVPATSAGHDRVSSHETICVEAERVLYCVSTATPPPQ